MRKWRAVLLLFLVGLTVLGYALRERNSAPEEQPDAAELRVPVTNPLVEPDRPDLLGEPRIEEPPEEEP